MKLKIFLRCPFKVMTTVHDDQVLAERELNRLRHSAPHDLPVDVIVTPTRYRYQCDI